MGLKASLGARERVIRAIGRREVDRLPRDFDAEPPVVAGLLARLGLPDVESLRQRLQADIRKVGMGYHCPYTDGRNIWGMSTLGVGKTATVTHPLEHVATVAEIDAYAWPDPAWADVEGFVQAVAAARATGCAVAASSWGSIFGESYRLMGMEAFFIACAAAPELARAVIRHVTEFFLAVDRRAFEACGELIDLSYHGNDLGTQRGLLFSREMFVDYFQAPFTALLRQAHDFGLKTMFHTCGAVSELISDLLNAGVDVLDPVQVTAEGMDPAALKQRFGNRLCFHGGISAQRTLPFGTPAEVWEHVRVTCEIMKPEGGYIFCPDQTITADTPIDNVLAMYEAAGLFGKC